MDRLLLDLESRSARNDLDEFACDHGLSRAIVVQSQALDHLASVLCGILHGAHTGAHFGRGVFFETVVDQRGQLILLVAFERLAI